MIVNKELHMSKKILITRPIPEVGIQLLKKHGFEIDINDQENPPTKEELLKVITQKPYDAVVSLLTDTIDVNIFDNAPTVKLYANYATGFDNIDVYSANERGIVVTNAPTDESVESVAEHTIALMFILSRRIIEADIFMREGKYSGWSPTNFIGVDLRGKVIGLVGTGRIGERVAQYAYAFGMKVAYTDVVQNKKIEDELNAQYFSSLDELLKTADVVSLHVPLLKSTKHLINEARLSIMKPTSILINTSRGPVIDEKALEIALKDKKIMGAGLDVFEFEPHISENMKQLPNVVLTPHIASASKEARNQMAEVVAQNVIEFFEGKIPTNHIISK